jgi:hypothetical protein
MEEEKVKAYFEQQVRAIVERGESEPDGFRSYFSNREPKDDEILGLLAVTVLMSGDFPMHDFFPTPLEALAALSSESRAEICEEFRKDLKACLRQMTAA